MTDTKDIRPSYYQAEVRAMVGQDASQEEMVFVECFDLIDALELDFYLGNALKYLWRAGKKDGAPKLSDLKKIKTYIGQAIEREDK